MGTVIGIDLGTTNSCVAFLDQGKPLVFANQEGSTTTPSMVAFSDTGEKLVGAIAKRQIISDPENTLYSIKRLIGRKFDSPEVEEAKRFISFPLAETENGDVAVTVKGRTISLPEIQAEILGHMRKVAEQQLGEKVTEAVITVPAYFNDAQRQATKDAGQIAGLNVLRIINEPTAASLAYGLDRTGKNRIAIYDLGGGTFDISILEIGEGVFQVKATSGDTYLGGDDFDQRIMDYFLERFQKTAKFDLSGDKVALQRLKKAAEEAKHILSTEEQTTVSLPFLTITDSGPKHLEINLTRRKLEELVGDLIERTLEPCRQALRDSELKPEDIREVVLVGGQTRMPKIREVVTGFFGSKPQSHLNPDEVVAIGASVQGAVLTGSFKDVLLLDVTPLSLGLETKGGLFTVIIDRNTTIPTRKTLNFTTTEDNQTSVTVQVLQGERKMAADNTSLAKFELVDIPAAPKGFPKIEVTFDIDVNGILSVSAKDLGTGQSQEVKVTPASGLSLEEIDQIVQDARDSAKEDERKKALTLYKNEAEAAIYAAGNLINTYHKDMTTPQKDRLSVLIQNLRSASSGEDQELIQKWLVKLRKATDEILKSFL
jgi:molecular chaperone DnaK